MKATLTDHTLTSCSSPYLQLKMSGIRGYQELWACHGCPYISICEFPVLHGQSPDVHCHLSSLLLSCLLFPSSSSGHKLIVRQLPYHRKLSPVKTFTNLRISLIKLSQIPNRKYGLGPSIYALSRLNFRTRRQYTAKIQFHL